MKFLIYGLWAVLLTHCCKAQETSTLSYSTATTNFNLSSQNVWSSTCNPAGLNDIKKISFGALFQNHFFLKDVSTQYLSAALPVNKLICAGASAFRFGNNLFSKNELATALSFKFNEKLSGGMQLHCQFIYQSEEKNRWYAFPELGICYKINDRIVIASSLKNFLPNTDKERINDEKQILRLGLSYRFDKKVQSHVQCIFSNGKYPAIAAALDYHFNDALYFGLSISSTSQPFHFGVGYQLQKIRIHIDFSYHQQLGFSPMSSITL